MTGNAPAVGKLGNSNTMLVRHDYKRACYRAMLVEFSTDEVVEFFTTLPLVIEGREIKGAELFGLLWKEKERVPVYWECGTDNLIEAFLIRKGREVNPLLRKILWLNNKSTYIPGKVLLTWFYPKLETLFNSIDTRDMIFAMIALFTENYLPKHVHRRVKRWEDGDWVKSIQVFISDMDFGEYLDWDYEFIAGPQILNGPIMFGMPPFEGFGMIADTRPPETILWDKSIVATRENGVLRFNGEVVGRVATFHGFCRGKEIDLSKFHVPDLDIVEMDIDYSCPIRKRIVLHKGCAYGAPVFLNWVSHRKLKNHGTGLLNSFIGDLAREEALQNDELEKRHNALLAHVSGRAVFRYHRSDESITLNGRHFTKNIPAKILKYLLETYLRDGKSEFEYRELKRLFEISQGQKNANFEVRFYRLVEKLKEECPAVWVEKTGRGHFKLIVKGILDFQES
ncbi:MAG: hypothetical protein ABIW76_17685 [Fibrobacteria bacterium]